MTVTQNPGGELAESGSKKPWLLIGGGVAAAAVIGGGAFAATQMLGGGGDRPDSVLPGGAMLYAQVDLDPAAGQKVAAVRFFQGLDPELRERLDDGEWREWVWEQIQNETDGADGLDFETDIKPWLGDRAGLALLPAGDGEEPVVTIALQVEDGEAALAFFDERTAGEDEDFGYYLESDYLVFTGIDDLETVRAAVAAGTLAENDAFSSDMDDLGEQGIITMWADTAELSNLSTAALNPAMELTGAAADVDVPEVTGRMAATVRLTPDAIEMHGISRGVDGIALPEDSSTSPLVTELPADTAVAMSLENGAAMVGAAWDHFAAQYPEDFEQVTAEAAMEGFTLPDDLMVVLGDSMALAAGPTVVDAFMYMSPTDSSMPAIPIGYRTATDTTRLQTMLNELGMGAGVMQMSDDDGVLTLGLDRGYVDSLASGSGDTLGSTDLFKDAVADAEDAQAVFFVNVNPFEQYYLDLVTDTNTRRALESLGAVGMSATNESSSAGHFTLRFVADPQ